MSETRPQEEPLAEEEEPLAEDDPEAPQAADIEKDSDLDQCPHCGEEMYWDSPQCPECGEYATPQGAGKPWWWWGIGLAGGAAFVYMVLT